MTGKERVWKTIRFEGTDRLAMFAGRNADIAFVATDPPKGFVPAEPGMDEWGAVWKSFHPELGDQGQVVSFPLQDCETFDHYRFPDPGAEGRFDRMAEKIAKIDPDQFILGDLGLGAIHRLESLLGFEEYMMLLLLEPEKIEQLLDGIFGWLEGLAVRYAECGADGVIFFDDQAIQTGPLFSMDLWRELFAPRYTHFFRLVHEKGMAVFMHTCGNIQYHLPELIKCGADVIDNKQPEAWLFSPQAQEARGKVTFSTCIDIQQRMQHLSLDQIPAEVDRLIRAAATPEGGMIGTCYGKSDMEIDPEANARMLEAMEAFRW